MRQKHIVGEFSYNDCQEHAVYRQ